MNKRPKVILIAAISSNRVIGNKNKLIYKDKQDMDLFKACTEHQTVIMGRKTFESLRNNPLQNRLNIIVTSQEGVKYHSKNAPFQFDTKKSIKEAILYAAKINPIGDIYIIGGGEIYKQTIDIADEIYLSEFDSYEKGDTYFPELPSDFLPYSIQEYKNFIFKQYKRY